MNRNRNRKHLFLTSTILRGRRFKDGEEGGGATSGGDNPAVNSGEEGGTNSSADNALPEGGADAFWKDPADKNGEPANQGDDDGDPDFGAGIIADINSFQAPDVFTADIAKQIADGDLAGVNTAINKSMQAAVQRSVVLTAKIMQAFEKSMDAKINGVVTSSNVVQKDENLLRESFPSYAKPAMQKTIHGVFQQSLKHTGGDRDKALAMTRGMLKQMGQLGQEDFGIKSAPSSPDDFQGEGPSSLVRDLLAM